MRGISKYLVMSKSEREIVLFMLYLHNLIEINKSMIANGEDILQIIEKDYPENYPASRKITPMGQQALVWAIQEIDRLFVLLWISSRTEVTQTPEHEFFMWRVLFCYNKVKEILSFVTNKNRKAFLTNLKEQIKAVHLPPNDSFEFESFNSIFKQVSTFEDCTPPSLRRLKK